MILFDGGLQLPKPPTDEGWRGTTSRLSEYFIQLSRSYLHPKGPGQSSRHGSVGRYESIVEQHREGGSLHYIQYSLLRRGRTGEFWDDFQEKVRFPSQGASARTPAKGTTT